MNLVVNLLLLFCIVKADDPKVFPQTISLGTGSSAYQIEGSWNDDGKSENIWDHWIHSGQSHIKNNDTGDVACDSYKTSYLDASRLSSMDVKHYSFSIPWSRILPKGFADEINMKAIMHYQHFLKYLEYDITPVITLYYHDLPQSLQDIGGWTNPAMVKYFVDYARVLFQYFPEVKYWITFNDPRATCRRGYGEGTFAPGIKSDGVGEYLCAYTVIKAHAAVYHLYKEEFKNLKGKISIALDMMWSEPSTANDQAAVERRNAFEFGLYANPIYKGNWPKEVIERIDYRSKNEYFTKSRLPKFTEEEISYIKGTSDFMAINLFYANMVEDTEEAEFGEPSYTKDMKVKAYLNSSWKLAVNGQPIVPWSARKALAWLSSTFNDPEIFITANGIPDIDTVDDSTRVNYFWDYLTVILDAINEDGIKVIGYTAWSLYDSFEWTDGYSYKFGLYRTDRSSEPPLEMEKFSLAFYRKVVQTYTIPEKRTTTTTTPTPGSATKILLCPAFILSTVFLLFN